MGKNFMHLEFQGAREHIVDKTIIETIIDFVIGY